MNSRKILKKCERSREGKWLLTEEYKRLNLEVDNLGIGIFDEVLKVSWLYVVFIILLLYLRAGNILRFIKSR